MNLDSHANDNTGLGLLALICAALILIAMLSVERSRGLAFKRKYYPWMVGGTVLVLTAVLLFSGQSPVYILVMIGAVIFLAVNDLTTSKVCPKCGAAYHPNRGFSPRDMQFCPKCGAPVEDLHE